MMQPEGDPIEFEYRYDTWRDPLSWPLPPIKAAPLKTGPSLLRSIVMAHAYWLAAALAGCSTIVAFDLGQPFIGGAVGTLTLFLIVKSKIHDIRAARHAPGPRQ